MKKTERLAYAAGLFDGEGTVTLAKHHSSDPFRRPVVSMTSTTRELIEFMHRNFGGNIRSQKVYQEHHKQSWAWKAEYTDAVECLKLLCPFLLEPSKIHRAKLILSEYAILTVRNGKYSDVQKKRKLGFEARFFKPTSRTRKRTSRRRGGPASRASETEAAPTKRKRPCKPRVLA